MTVYCSFDKRYSPKTKEEVETMIEITHLPIYYRYGYGWKGAEKKPVDKKTALRKLNTMEYVAVEVSNDMLLVNAYSVNDLW